MCVFVYLVVVSTLFIINVADCYLDETNIGFMQEHHPNRVVEFVYYKSSRSWNEARNTCREIGGDLAMFQDKRDVHIVTNMFSKHSNTIHNNYWIGLCNGLDNLPVWVGMCEVASPHSLENYDIGSTSSALETNKCFIHQANLFHRGRRENCGNQMPFMCQRYLGEECSIGWTNGRTEIDWFYSLTKQQCIDRCNDNIYCTDALYDFRNSIHVCVIYNSYDSAPDLLYLAKQCLKVSVNSTLFLLTQNLGNTLSEPNSDCSTDQSVVNSQTTTTTTYVSESLNTETLCPCPTTTQNHYTTTDSTVSTDLTSTIDRAISPTSSSEYFAPSTHECSYKMSGINITEFEASAIAKQLQKNLTVNAKETSAYVRKLTSANDERKSSAVMGWVGILCVILPIALLFLSDCRAIISHVKYRVCSVHNDQHTNSNRCTIPLEEMHTR